MIIVPENILLNLNNKDLQVTTLIIKIQWKCSFKSCPNYLINYYFAC